MIAQGGSVPRFPQLGEGLPVLTAHGLSKRYLNGVIANREVSLQITCGEVHAVVGENGAGKSTLMKMLYGLESPSEGHIRLRGRLCHFDSPADAIAAGIGLVPQHLQLVTSMTVAENVVLGAEPTRGLSLDRAAAERRTAELSERHGLAVDPTARVSTLAAGVRQRVEILKALHRGARVLLLDEPTALLSPTEADGLFESLRHMVRAGLAVVLITHRLSEVRDTAHRYTVLRAGCVAGSGRPQEVTDDQLCEQIVGAPLSIAPVPRVDARGREPLLRVRDLTLVRPGGRPELFGLSLDIAAGEILGIAGVEGNGQDRLSDVLSGLQSPSQGHAAVGASTITGQGVRHAQAAGVFSIAEDRLHAGVAPNLSLADNTISLDYRRHPWSRYGMLDSTRIRERAAAMIKRLNVRAAGVDVAIGTLSGGNMQKVVFGRALAAQPRVLLANQPTRGVDMGAAETLRRHLVTLRDAGTAVLLVSSDLDELIALSDRVAVMHEGRIVAHFAAEAATPHGLSGYMTGLHVDRGADATLASPFTVDPRACAR